MSDNGPVVHAKYDGTWPPRPETTDPVFWDPRPEAKDIREAADLVEVQRRGGFILSDRALDMLTAAARWAAEHGAFAARHEPHVLDPSLCCVEHDGRFVAWPCDAAGTTVVVGDLEASQRELAEAWDSGHLDGCEDQPFCQEAHLPGRHLLGNPFRASDSQSDTPDIPCLT